MSNKTKVALFKGGTQERTVEAGKIAIPDLWHIAQAIRTGDKITNKAACCEQILDCWHICGALRAHIIKQPKSIAMKRRMTMKVGTICKLKVDCLDNKAGTLGVVFYDYGDGFQAIFENGQYDGFSLLDSALSFGAKPTEADYFLEQVGFEESLAGYQFKNVMQVSADYRKGLFNIAWSEGWKQSAKSVESKAKEYEKCEVYVDGNRPALLRFKRNIRGTVQTRHLSVAMDFVDFSHFEYAALGKSNFMRWTQSGRAMYPEFVVFHKNLYTRIYKK